MNEDTTFTLHQVAQMGWLPPGIAREMKDKLEAALSALRQHEADTLNDWREQNGGERVYTFFHEDGPLTLTEAQLVDRFGCYWEALQRLASHAAFTTALDLRHSSRDAIAAELAARGEYAEGVLSGAVRPRAPSGPKAGGE